ncbi:hypothetical protein CH63R_03985 [Colletotrichum higginsianum IMI 349063]|uniref:Uncharacterized protein n=1 Tax=Colletotrichum higginsianum (strain IMI 349063) TaxID=759273 RepID=A0A1B7YHY2_COLHI|nr:hypothetical protein CH63R_03985 [Colletotrichum higginsianum IMI 349063]OBR11689.1 hypothetical protein CH63R_03985 [Colletotrichum higginsianum IMI 349063]
MDSLWAMETHPPPPPPVQPNNLDVYFYFFFGAPETPKRTGCDRHGIVSMADKVAEESGWLSPLPPLHLLQKWHVTMFWTLLSGPTNIIVLRPTTVLDATQRQPDLEGTL